MAVNLSPVGGVAGQFFDNNGNPLSGGKIFTYAAGTTTNQVTYTSATGLTAHSNPIILDSGGRVPSGEIWLTDGLQYKFVIQSSTNQLIGTFDNISGINSNFVNYTIQEEIQTATAGQTVFTLTTMSYSPATNSLSVFVDGVNQYEGGSYSYIETNSTTVTFTAGLHVGAEVKFTTAVFTAGSVGNAANVTYDPAGLGAVPTNVQAKLRETVSVKDFGAVGDGVVDDRAALQTAADYAISAQKTLYFPAGNYYVNSISPTPVWGAAVYVVTDQSFNVICDPNATIIAGPTLESEAIAFQGNGAVIRINRATAVTGGKISWSGGKFDFSALTGLITGIDGISVGPKYQEVLIDNIVFDHGVQAPSGDQYGSGGGDSSIFCKEPEFISVTNCQFLGAPDLGVYLSGDLEDLVRIGRHAVISNNYFYRCGGGVGVKRVFQKTIVANNHFFECANGIFMGVASSSTDTGKRITIANNFINKIQGNPIRISNCDYATVTGNEILDYRRWVSDGTTETVVAAGNVGGAVLFEGSSYFTVTGNVLGFDEWLPVTTATKFTVGVSIRDFTATGLGSSNGVVVGNTIKTCQSTFLVSDLSSNNLLSPNTVEGMIAVSDLGTDLTNLDLNLIDQDGTGLRYNATGQMSLMAGGVESLRVQTTVNGVNNLAARAGVAGSPAVLGARGADTNINIHLVPKGSLGLVQFGTHSGVTTETVTGFIIIKDSSGVDRKLAVVS
jgi:hypothetical protein